MAVGSILPIYEFELDYTNQVFEKVIEFNIDHNYWEVIYNNNNFQIF